MGRGLRAAGVLLLYAGLVLWLTWPLGAHLATHRIDINPVARVDPVYTTWVLAWETHALATDPLRFVDANIFHPVAGALLYGPTALGLLPYFAPTFLLTDNPTLALNLALLACITLTAWTIHLAARHWTGMDLPGLVAGWTFLTNRFALWVLPLAPHTAALLYMPPIAVLAARPLVRRGERIVLLVLIVLQCLADPMYVAPVVALPLGLLGLARVVRRSTRAEGLRLLGVLALALLALSPVYAGYARVWTHEPLLAQQGYWPPDAVRFPPLPWRLLTGASAVPLVALIVLVLGTLCFVVRARRGSAATDSRSWAGAGLWTVVSLVASNVPPVGPFRRMGSLGTGAAIGLALLTGLALAELLRVLSAAGRWRVGGRVGRALLVAGVALAMLVDYRDGYRRVLLVRHPLPESYDLREAPIPNPEAITVLRGLEGPVLDLPVLYRRPATPVFHVNAMYRSIFHHHPLLNGYASYWPDGFDERMALAKRLPDPGAVRILARRAGLALVMVNLDEMMLLSQLPWRQLAKDGGNDALRLVFADDRTLLFAVVPSATAQPGAGMRRSAAIATP